MKGSVRPLAATVSAEEAEKAAEQVRGAIAEKQKKLSDFRKFSDENQSLSQLVLQLPDSVSHRVMVPFGKAAFFPGKLVHTNELLVLLGENHYAERSAKQAAEILHRRSELLARQISGAAAEIADLEAELAFVANAAEEASAGMVEIREEVTVPENPVSNLASGSRIARADASSQRDAGFAPDTMASVSTSSSRAVHDPEHDRLMARLSELEMAEAKAGDETEDEEDEDDRYRSGDTGAFDPGREVLRTSGISERGRDTGEEYSDSGETEDEDELGISDDEDDERANDDRGGGPRTGHEGHSTSEGFAAEVIPETGTSAKPTRQQRAPFQSVTSAERPAVSVASARKVEKSEIIQVSSDLERERRAWNTAGEDFREPKRLERQADVFTDGSASREFSKVQKIAESAGPKPRAFTGKVTEHNFETEHNFAQPVASNGQQVQEVQPSRPISKFKMRHSQVGRK